MPSSIKVTARVEGRDPQSTRTPEPRAPRPACAGTGADGADGAAFRAGCPGRSAGLAARLDREHERAAHREAVIDRLHEENQRLRRGELQGCWSRPRGAVPAARPGAPRVRPARRARAGRTARPRQTALLLAALADDVADALARLGVERFTVEAGALRRVPAPPGRGHARRRPAAGRHRHRCPVRRVRAERQGAAQGGGQRREARRERIRGRGQPPQVATAGRNAARR